ncbi:HlyD family efflux transporter periplasmic adaptor subunit [Luteimonas sp. RD2P54]|uniref:HlyD family efflux transporter periplasmic adaptor subunit n=1 Tax=Luteimonas endophytica TaxID=3042023 RepID=A0ABT6JAL5_9GAMM|nr:HlyD family efflux transporter periplasmic adaptor subunit [Luteimonas endophytica]MDH5823851.1 HlyD family efflux transporter periplasmic adaptor subunit [Luteimonas endophytica]
MANERMRRIAALVACTLTLAGCRDPSPRALGTLEYDRITLPAPAAERIVAIEVREGERVEAGQALVTLERSRGAARLQASLAEAERQRDALAELRAGARSEDIDQARAELDAARAQARDARAYHARLRPLAGRQLVAAADLDRARAAAGLADARVEAAAAALAELRNGTRPERIAQAEAAVRAAEAQARVERATAERLAIVAPRAGRVDSLPYRLGDEAPAGAPLAVLLVGDAPYARIHVPEPIRAGVAVGDAARVFVGDDQRAYLGRVRMIRSEPAFTPYYALTGEDAARLSYLAEVQLDAAAAELPAGLPVRVEFDVHD